MQVFYYFSLLELFEITNQIPRAKVETLLDRWRASLAPFPVGARQDEAGLRRADDAVRRIQDRPVAGAEGGPAHADLLICCHSFRASGITNYLC